MTCPVIVGVSGSLRKGSFNASLLRAAAELAPERVTVERASIHGIPLYDGDVEQATGLPPAVKELKEKIAASAGLLIVTPEYNNSIPGVLKNAIDWLSRPSDDIARVFGGRPVALMGASAGRFGTVMSQAAWLPVLRALGVQPWWGPRLLVGGAANVFDETGRLVDGRVRAEITAFMSGFADFVGARGSDA
jgi:NAD(P)H-dependent FMN reductase